MAPAIANAWHPPWHSAVYATWPKPSHYQGFFWLRVLQAQDRRNAREFVVALVIHPFRWVTRETRRNGAHSA